jgi:hypothetical protein
VAAGRVAECSSVPTLLDTDQGGPLSRIPDTDRHCSDTAPTLLRHCSDTARHSDTSVNRHCPDTAPPDTAPTLCPDTAPTLLDTPTLRHSDTAGLKNYPITPGAAQGLLEVCGGLGACEGGVW